MGTISPKYSAHHVTLWEVESNSFRVQSIAAEVLRPDGELLRNILPCSSNYLKRLVGGLRRGMVMVPARLL